MNNLKFDYLLGMWVKKTWSDKHPLIACGIASAIFWAVLIGAYAIAN